MKRFIILAVVAGVLTGWIAETAHGAIVSLSSAFYLTQFDDLQEAEPRATRSYFVTSDADILSIQNVRVTVSPMGQLFQVDPPFGSNIEPPNPAFIALNRALAYDSWITTPGETALTGGDLPGDGTGAWGDATDDGPQTTFQFARLTTSVGVLVRFAGVVRVAGEHGPEEFPFSIVDVREPGGVALAVLAGLGLARARQRQASRVGL